MNLSSCGRVLLLFFVPSDGKGTLKEMYGFFSSLSLSICSSSLYVWSCKGPFLFLSIIVNISTHSGLIPSTVRLDLWPKCV